MNIIQLFKNRNKQKEADRLYNIFKNVDIKKRIEYIADLEFRKMLIDAEKAALNGETSVTYTLDVEDDDMIYFNQIIHNFIDKLYDENFTYARKIITSKKTFVIYFSKSINF